MPAFRRLKSRLRSAYALVSRPGRLVRSLAYQLGLYRVWGVRFEGLHLGCGNTRIEGYCNLDGALAADSDLIGAVNRLHLADDTVGAIYCSHTFEHIPRRQAEAVLRQWRRVLRPGGTLYLAVPDFEALCRVYLENLDKYETPEGRKAVDLARDITYGGQDNKFNFHFNGLSFTTAREHLRAIGFKNIARWSDDQVRLVKQRHGIDARINDAPVSLNIMAVK